MDRQQFDDPGFISKWTIEILRFFGMNSPRGSSLYDDSIEAIKQAYERNNKRGLKMCFRDVNEMAFDLDPVNYAELNGILNAKFGIDLEYFNKKTKAKVKAIIKRGFIKNSDEYRLMLERTERIYDDPEKHEELDAINKLLIDYSDTHAPVDE